MQTMTLPAGWVPGMWFVLQVLNSLASDGAAGVAWYVHLGGFVGGMVLVPIFKRRGVRLLQPARGGHGGFGG